jgi:hypothetical protein
MRHGWHRGRPIRPTHDEGANVSHVAGFLGCILPAFELGRSFLHEGLG